MILNKKDIQKMNNEERKAKLQELRLSLTKSTVSANKTNAKTKEIKKAIARILTFNTEHREAKKN